MNALETTPFDHADNEKKCTPASARGFSSSIPPSSDVVPLKEVGMPPISSSVPDTPTTSEYAMSDSSRGGVKGEAWVVQFSTGSRKQTSGPPPFRSTPRVTPPAIPQEHLSPPPAFPALTVRRMISRKEREVLQGKHRCAPAVGSKEEDEGGKSIRMKEIHSSEATKKQAETDAGANHSSLGDYSSTSSPSPILPPFAETHTECVLPVSAPAPLPLSSFPVDAAVHTFTEGLLPCVDALTTKRILGASDGTLLSSSPTPPLLASSSSSAVLAVGTSTKPGSERIQTQDGNGLEDAIPHYPDTTRQDLEKRLVLSVPRLCCIQKQYPRSCGITSLVSVYNYLYSRLGESFSAAEGIHRPPFTQEEIISTLGFAAPFGDIPWGTFTGNITLIRWFHALNAHFGHQGRAYILYKVHGPGNTSHVYQSDAQALVAVKEALRNPHCAIIYHCYNHYMVPIGYQEIPHDQKECLRPDVATDATDTTVFIGEVSRGKHEAMYARKWKDIVKDLSCYGETYFNIRQPEKGIQRKEKSKCENDTKTSTVMECEGKGSVVSISVEEEGCRLFSPAVEDEDEDMPAMDGGTPGDSSLPGKKRKNESPRKRKEPQNPAKEIKEKQGEEKTKRNEDPGRTADLVSSTLKGEPPSTTSVAMTFSEGPAVPSEGTSRSSRPQTPDRERNVTSSPNPPSEVAATPPSTLDIAPSAECASTPLHRSEVAATFPSISFGKKKKQSSLFHLLS